MMTKEDYVKSQMESADTDFVNELYFIHSITTYTNYNIIVQKEKSNGRRQIQIDNFTFL